ncbi:MAG: hypothetical protein M0R80_30275 [Proteobacteria bacterium]|jgi:hypothetical protein|nr:hypothetical protein [Pseudomonadota bacterium]
MERSRIALSFAVIAAVVALLAAHPAAAEPDASDSPYDRSRAFWISAGPMLGAVALGFGFAGIGVAAGVEGPLFGVGAGVAGLGIAVAPSIGHFWVGNGRQAWWCLSLRTAFTVATALFTYASLTAGFAGSSSAEANAEHGGESTAFLALAIASATAVAALVIIDLATVPRAARRANEKAARPGGGGTAISDAAVAPFVAPGHDGTTAAGLAFSMRF